MTHEKIEKNIVLMGVLIALVISVGGFIQIVPLMAAGIGQDPAPGVEPYSALRLAGRDTAALADWGRIFRCALPERSATTPVTA